MRRYAEAAIVHARQQHLLEIDFSEQSLCLVDSLLDRCRGATPPSELHSLAPCYGSWLGSWRLLGFRPSGLECMNRIRPGLR